MRSLIARLWAPVALALVLLLVLAPAALAGVGASTDTPDINDDLGSWAALVGIALPALTAVLQKVTWPSWVNAVVFAVAVVVASVVYGFIRFGGDLSWAHWEGSLLAIVVWGVGTYHTFWNPGNKATSPVNKIRASVGVR